MNCNAGQLIDVCNDYAFWRVKEDCCIDTSPYIIRTEKIQKENSDFYANMGTTPVPMNADFSNLQSGNT